MTYEELARSVVDHGYTAGGVLYYTCFWCGGDDVDESKPPGQRRVDHIIHRDDCLYVKLEMEVGRATL